MNAHTAPEIVTLSKLQRATARPLIRIVIVGHVDHGKSTLIGRLLSETGSLPHGKLEQLKAVSARRGMAFEWSFLLDALQTERDQGITIDTSQIRFRTPSRDFVLIDAPGHTEFLRNMITGAAQADAALLLVDAAEGVREQTLRHAYLLHLLGIRQVVVVINKMDRVGYDERHFRDIKAEIAAHLAGFGLKPAAVIPISARHGDGIVARTPGIAWYHGPTVIDALDRFAPAQPATALPLRLPVQAVYKFDDRRIIAGRLQSGRIAVGDEIVAAPSGKRAIVRSIEIWPAGSAGPQEAGAGQSVGITLDRELFIARGDMIASPEQPALSGRRLRARVFWLHDVPLAPGASLTVRLGAAETVGTITAVANTLDPGDQSAAQGSGRREVGQNHVGEVEIALSSPVAADLYEANPRTGRVVLEYGGRIAGGGLLLALDDGEAAIPASDAVTFKVLTEKARELDRVLSGMSLAGRLADIRKAVEGAIVFTTSFGPEDQVILHHICEAGLDIDVVTLDTGRLFPETYATWEETEQRYGRRIRAFYPEHGALERLIAAQGINGFYRSKDARVACCDVRKVEPLGRALAGAQGWVTGLRADQSAARGRLSIVSADRERNLLKFNPLIDWTRQAVQDFAAAHQVPTNPLHQKGFLSIGCAPCTRAVRPGESERAGRWWWEDESKKECGLHIAAGAVR
jgi:sulfate adenylyltransferase large subunit/thioredoxin-dependent adenylylsulfate APS reductase